VFADLPGTNNTSVGDFPMDGPELPQGEERTDRKAVELMMEAEDDRPNETPYDPHLGSLSDLDRSPVGRRRRRIGGMAPAAMLLPLVLVSLVVYLLKPGWFQPAETSVQTQPIGGALATSLPSLSIATEEVATPPPAPMSAEEFDDLLTQAEALTWQSEFEEAIAIYQGLARQAPDDARPEIGWARALLLDGLPDQALSHARLALALDPTNVEAAIALARAYVGVGDKTRGLSAAQGALVLDPHHGEAHAVLAEAYLLNGQFHKAIEEADAALAQDRSNAEAHRVRGKLYEVVEDDLYGAIRELQLAADLQPRLWLHHYELGWALFKAEDHDAAIVALTEAWVLRRTLLTYGALGKAYYRLGEYDRAASYLEQSLAAGAWSADTYALLASINAQRGRCGDATIYAKQALAQDPNSPLALKARDACQESGSAHAATPSFPSTTQDQAEISPTLPAFGGRIAFPVWNVETGQYDTYVANVDGSERELVIEGMHQPAFSPDGQWLAVNGERQENLNLFIVRPDGSGLQEITEHVEDGLPCWSLAPLQANTDEPGLAFSSTRHGDKQSRIYVLDQVPLDGQKAQARPLNSGPDDVRGEYPAWTADTGQARIVYSGCHYDGVSAQCGLMLMSAESGAQTPQPLTAHPEDTAPAAHGSQIAFMSNRDGNWEIYLVNSDGSGIKRLTHNASNDGLPTWAPGGRAIAFVSDQGGVWAVWILSPDGSGRRKLFEIGGGGLAFDWPRERITWGP
jgi:tetratricopeptide (TPR) repeat protein